MDNGFNSPPMFAETHARPNPEVIVPVTTDRPIVFLVPPTSTQTQVHQYDKTFPKKTVVWLGAIQLFVSFVCILTQIIGIAYPYDGIAYSLSGIWCGLIFGFSGAFGIVAGLAPSRCSIITFMVFAIIAASFCLPFIFISSIGVASSAHERLDHYHQYNSTIDIHYPHATKELERKVTHAVFTIQVLVCLIQAGVAIASSVMTCKAVCCSSNVGGMLYYTNSRSTQFNTQQIVNQQPEGNPPSYAPLHVSLPTIPNSSAANNTSLPGATIMQPDGAYPGPPQDQNLANKMGADSENITSKYQRFD